ncbi:MAG: carboxypeptidase-like regulatory domain-containing protein [Phycisphaerae bacterium]
MLRKSNSVPIVALLACLILPGFLAAGGDPPSGSGDIEGVTLKEGEGKGASVYVIDDNNDIIAETISDEVTGAFSLENVPTGTYKVFAKTGDGLEGSEQATVEVFQSVYVVINLN